MEVHVCMCAPRVCVHISVMYIAFVSSLILFKNNLVFSFIFYLSSKISFTIENNCADI